MFNILFEFYCYFSTLKSLINTHSLFAANKIPIVAFLRRWHDWRASAIVTGFVWSKQQYNLSSHVLNHIWMNTKQLKHATFHYRTNTSSARSICVTRCSTYRKNIVYKQRFTHNNTTACGLKTCLFRCFFICLDLTLNS